MSFAHFIGGRTLVLTILAILLALAPVSVRSESDEDFRETETIRPDGIHILDGSYVLDAGEFHVNITNHGLIGSQFTTNLPFSTAASGEWPGGSGHEYLWGAGLWVGAMINGQAAVSTGQPEREFRPGSGIFDTIYEARNGKVIRPVPSDIAAGNRLPHWLADDDMDGQYDEDFLNGHDDDDDGLIDEDFGQLGDQMMTCTMYDNTRLASEVYPDHNPLGLSVVQRAATWYRDDKEKIVILEYDIYNHGYRVLDDIYLGFYVDCDIQRRGVTSSGQDDYSGFFKGAIRGSDGSFQRIELAWMRDGDPSDPLPGWVGTILLDHKTDFTQITAPHRVKVRSYQVFATNARLNQDGEPKSDEDRHYLMSRDQHDPDRRIDQPGDLKYMISSGPFNWVKPGEKLFYRLAMVVGNGQADMLASAVKASELVRGHWFNLDNDWTTGSGGRETKICIGDVPKYESGREPYYSGYRFNIPDETCVGPDPIFGYEVISKNGMEPNDDGVPCTWVNADNCEECFRAVGQDCTVENQLYFEMRDHWDRVRYPRARIYTGYGGAETRVPWVGNEERPPSPPNMRLVPGDNQVEVFWDDISEHEPDFLRDVIDFESYQVWRVANFERPPGTGENIAPQAFMWGMLQQYDLANFVEAGVGESQIRLPLGQNTTLEPAVYVPTCLSDSTFGELTQVIQEFVDADTAGRFLVRPRLRDSKGAVIPGREVMIPWEAWPTVLDTFFAVAARPEAPGVIGKRSTGYYHYIDKDVLNGFQTFYSVIATDHSLFWDGENWIPSGPGLQTEAGNNFQVTIPTAPAQTAAMREKMGTDIYVYPNPATRESLAEFQKQPPSKEDPTGERIMFTNLPAANNVISIFTASGDHVKSISHNGLGGSGQASWNLVSRNGQEIVSGIYLYTVQSDDSRFEDFQGRFVVIR